MHNGTCSRRNEEIPWGFACEIERLTLDLSTVPIPKPATETLTRIEPPFPPLLSDPLVDAVTSGKSSDNGQKCRQYFDRFVRPFFSAHRPSKVCAFRRKKFDGTKKSLNRSINGREKKMEIERAHRACENFISQRTGKDNKEEGEWIYLTFGDL